VKFSVIVPLDAHRGHAEKCVRAWAQGQTLARDLYEVIVVAPPGLSSRHRSQLKDLLGASDRLILGSANHDITLASDGAREAVGDFLFFTEAHCWPESEVLEKTMAAFQEHPEWSALSGRLLPVTSNALSRVVADMYQSQMKSGVLDHQWRKVIDPCFAIRREVYAQSGGFEADQGHFAEWSYAARLYQMGFQVGYASEARIHHSYDGKIGELNGFTRDFIDGELALHARLPRDSRLDLLPPVDAWSVRHNWSRHLTQATLRAGWREWRRRHAHRAEPVAAVPSLKDLARWLAISLWGASLDGWLARLTMLGRRCRLLWTLRFSRPEKLNSVFLDYLSAVIRERRLHFLRRHQKEFIQRSDAVARGWTAGQSEWEPGRPGGPPALGLHLPEVWNGEPFRWSEPTVMLDLSLPAGECILVIECLPVRPPPSSEELTFYFNGNLLPPKRVKFRKHRITLKLRVPSGGDCLIGWFCRPYLALGDSRPFGVALQRLSWQPASLPRLLLLAGRHPLNGGVDDQQAAVAHHHDGNGLAGLC